MLSIEIPGRGQLEIKNVVLDVNGTIAIDNDVPLKRTEKNHG